MRMQNIWLLFQKKKKKRKLPLPMWTRSHLKFNPDSVCQSHHSYVFNLLPLSYIQGLIFLSPERLNKV